MDPELRIFVLTPNHPNHPNHPSYPSYPAAHACYSSAAATVLGYLFPSGAEAVLALAVDESRLWAGIHYPSDVVAGAELARAVTGKVIDRARSDGS